MRVSKHSKQRDLVLRILRSTRCHPTAEWIYDKARVEIPNISLGTVYRNLNILAEEGKIQRFSFEGASTQYDADLRDHYHIRCVCCLKIEDVPHNCHRVKYEEIEKLTGYRIHSLQLTFYGLCPKCQRGEVS